MNDVLSRLELAANTNPAEALKLLPELFRAVHEGLIVELPCKPVTLPCKYGDKIRATVLRPYNGHTATIYGEVIGIVITDKIMVHVLYDSCRKIEFHDSDFGDTVFVIPKAEERLESENHA